MKPGHGEVLLAEGDPRVREDEERLVEEFRRQLDEGMRAAVPTTQPASGRREAPLVKGYPEIPQDAHPVIFFPRAAGGWPRGPAAAAAWLPPARPRAGRAPRPAR